MRWLSGERWIFTVALWTGTLWRWALAFWPRTTELPRLLKTIRTPAIAFRPGARWATGSRRRSRLTLRRTWRTRWTWRFLAESETGNDAGHENEVLGCFHGGKGYWMETGTRTTSSRGTSTTVTAPSPSFHWRRSTER
jgi:hypothetical protein